jgi:flavin reductase (DIM6/NTAB) family NADH-FMN oxidoreductase RutF
VNLKRYVPVGIKRRLKRVYEAVFGRPESSFMRVAYSTPRQVVLITTRHAGVDNVWPLDFHVPLAFEPALYGIAAQRGGYGASLVRGSGVFVVNFVPATWEKTIFLCGSVSGRAGDKFAAAGLQKEEAESVDAPRLAHSLGALECRVRQTIELGDHTLFIGEVTRTIVRAEAPRLHHLDVRLKGTAADFEGGSQARP